MSNGEDRSLGEPVGNPSQDVVEAPRARPRLRRWEWLHNQGATLVVGVVAAAAAIVGGRIAADGALDAAVAQHREEAIAAQKLEVRVKRADVYAEYLASANSYFLATAEYYRYLASFNKGPIAKGRSFKVRFDQNGVDLQARWLKQRARFQGSVNDVYVYGSDDAWRAQKTISEVLPPSVGAEVKTFEFSVRRDVGVDFDRGYHRFLRLVCIEVGLIRPDEKKTCHAE